MKKHKIDHYSGIGGQAVLEGVMMRNKDMYAVAVRKPDGDIAVFHSIVKDKSLFGCHTVYKHRDDRKYYADQFKLLFNIQL